MYKHWSEMNKVEKLECMKDLYGIVHDIPAKKLNMITYIDKPIRSAPGTNNLADIISNPKAYHNCNTAFCVIGWVAPIERFAVAFNVRLDIEKYYDDEYVRIHSFRQHAFDAWIAIPELEAIFNQNTDHAPGTLKQKKEVLERIDNLIAILQK